MGKTNLFRRISSLVIIFSLILQQAGFAQVSAQVDLSGYLCGLKSDFVKDIYRPAHLRYFSYDNLTNNFKLLVEKGDFLKKVDSSQETVVSEKENCLQTTGYCLLKQETNKLLEYFLTGVSLPDDMFWVNLRPDSQDQVIDNWLEKTDVGKIMLEADLQLKKDTAMFTSPETTLGRKYWDKLYKKAAELYGYDNVTIPTLTRPWIVPGEIIVREAKDSAYVYKAVLKVMLEEDYLKVNSSQKSVGSYEFNDPRAKELNTYSTQLIRELIIPKLTKEINSSKRYDSLRQVYYSLILSRWFKARFGARKTEKTGYVKLIDSRNLTNLTSQQAWSKEAYYKQYQKSFAEGEYNIKEPVSTPTGQVIRSYFSGGIQLASSGIESAMVGFTGGEINPAVLTQQGLMAITGKADNAEIALVSSGVEDLSDALLPKLARKAYKIARELQAKSTGDEETVSSSINVDDNSAVTLAPILLKKIQNLSRVENGIIAGVGLSDVHGRIFEPVNNFFTPEGKPNSELSKFIDSLSDLSVQETIHAGIMYYDIRSEFWKENPAFTVAFALAFAKKLQEKTGKQEGIILHIGVDAYHKHFEAAQLFVDAILRTGICDNGGGIYYWGVINGGDIRNYSQFYDAVNGEGGNWVFFTMSHRPEDFLGAKLGINAQVYCGSEIRHAEGVTSGTLYDAIIELKQKDFNNLKHNNPVGTIINIKDMLVNNIKVVGDMIRATSAKEGIPDNQLLAGLELYVDMGGSPIAKNLIDILRGFGADVEVGNAALDRNFNTANIIDPNEHRRQDVERQREIAKEKNKVVVYVDPDGDRAGMAAILPSGEAISMTGSELLLLSMENLAKSFHEKGKTTPTIISDMRTGLGAKDLEGALNAQNLPVIVVPHEAGYPFFMRGMSTLPADLAVENTLHAFTNPMTNLNWGASKDYKRRDGKGYQGGDNAALYLIYLLGCMKYQWEGRNPAEQLEWVRKTYGLKPTVVDERKPAMLQKDDKYKYLIAEKMKKIAKEWFEGREEKFLINFNNPKVELVSGVHITNAMTRAMVLVRFSNTGASYTISGEGYLKESDDRSELDEMLGLGYLLITTAVKQLHEEGNQFTFDIKDAANLAGKFNPEKYNLTGVPKASSAIMKITPTLSVNLNEPFVFFSDEDTTTDYLPASSAVRVQLAPKEIGAIDFRGPAMQIKFESGFKGMDLKLPLLSESRLNKINIDSEIRQIKQMVNSGISPSDARLMEIAAACEQKGEMSVYGDDLLLCITRACGLAEANGEISSRDFITVLARVDSRS